MKIITAMMMAVIVFCASEIAAQTVTITGQRVVYTRPKPFADHKRRFTVNYPKVRAATSVISRKIESAISYARVFKLNIQQERTEIQWLDEADFTVDHNAYGVLAVTLSLEGSAAYPSGSSRSIVISTRTGSVITPAQAFVNPMALLDRIRSKQKAEIDEERKRMKEDPDAADIDPDELFSDKEFDGKDLEHFTLDRSGITFIYDYGFPHVIKALEPEGRYSFRWAEIAEFIRPAGPLGGFVRIK